MPADALLADLESALAAVPIFDAHSHLDPRAPAARSLDDILGYHYYTELAHSCGVPQAQLASDLPPGERVRAVLGAMPRFRNAAPVAWFRRIAELFFGWDGSLPGVADFERLSAGAGACFARPGWDAEVLAKSDIDCAFLTNEFDDDLTGFDSSLYVPCLRTDALVFGLGEAGVRARLACVTSVEVGSLATLSDAFAKLADHFLRNGARACAISLPPGFAPRPVTSGEFDSAFRGGDTATLADAAFWALAEACNDRKLPFDLMLGVNRNVYEAGVYQGRDLFDTRWSLIQYRRLFNAFPRAVFPVSVLSSVQNQELVAYSWLFPNVRPFGHWWYSNVPAYITRDLRERLQAVPFTKLLGYYSDAYKSEFILPKYEMYRQCLANVLADDFVRPGLMTESEAVAVGVRLLRGSAEDVFARS